MTFQANKRRNFIKQLALSISAGLALIGAKQLIAKDKPQVSEPTKQNSQGYRETVHVKAYYQSARF